MFSGKLLLSDDEDDFFGDVESTGSNLSNIFGVSLNQPKQQKTKDSNLKYVSPKQTKQTKSNDTTTTAEPYKTTGESVQLAKVVTVFKLVNQDNVALGKLGLAVLKSDHEQYKIILYRTKTKVVSTCTMKADLKIFLKKPYFQYRDDLNIFWSILFENEEDEKQVVDLIRSYVILEESIDKKHNNLENAASPENEMQNQHTIDDHQSTDAAAVAAAAADVPTENNSSDEKSKERKAQILSRMAKMGQPLPRLKPTTTNTKDISDSSDTEIETRILPKPIAVPRKPKLQQIISVVSSEPAAIPSLSPYNTFMNAEAQCLSMLFTENRTQNTEVRMNMSKLETKIDKVLDKIDIINYKDSRGSDKCKEDEILELEEKLLHIKKENRTLKLKIDELENERSERVSKIESLKHDDITEFKNLIEMFNIKVDEFESPSELFKELLRKYYLHGCSLNSTIDDYKKSLENNESLMKSIKLEHEQKFSELSKENLQLNKTVSDMEHRLKELDKEKNDLSTQLQKSEKASADVIDSVLKDIMNNLYQTLVTKFEDNKNFTSPEILRICGEAIKQKTNNAIKKKECNN